MKRVTLFCGHYGSGKTNLAVNYALHLRTTGREVSLADLDIVNPYFRSKDSEAELEAAGIRVIALPFAGSNVDLPALPAEAYSLVQDRNRLAVLDIGGDDRGAYALGRYRDGILEENDYENIFVANFRRPLTPSAEDAIQVMQEITDVSGIPFTAVVNNTNLGAETTPDIIYRGAEETKRLSKLCGLPFLFTAADAKLRGQLDERAGTVFYMNLQKRPTEE